jgi:hypothetical protein
VVSSAIVKAAELPLLVSEVQVLGTMPIDRTFRIF